MIQRFVRDESGITLAVTVFMVLLISVMGAGLLTFVMSDTGSVLEVNKGQKAMDIAEAGVQAAKAHLRVDSFRQHYDTSYTNDCPSSTGPQPPSVRLGGSLDWSKSLTTWNTADCNAASGTSTRTASNVGVTRNFDGGQYQVTIECFHQNGDATGAADPCVGGANAPDSGGLANAGALAKDKKFFKITSTGYDTVAGTGAKRKIEAVYTTSIKTYAPIAFWTPKNIDFNGSTTVRKMSFFAGGNITNINNVTPDTTNDALYGDWDTTPLPYNNTPRLKPGLVAHYTTPGFGAVGRVCGQTSCSSDADSVADGYRDYDSTTGTKGQNKKFVANYTTPSTQITFPFEEGNALTDPSQIVDPGQLDEIRATAQGTSGQSHCYSMTPRAGYCSVDANTTTDIGRIQGGKFTITSWPAQGTVVFVQGIDVDFKVDTPSSQDLPKGVIVVQNGNFSFANAGGNGNGNSRKGFNGVIIVVGNGTGANGQAAGTYTQGGSVQLDGYAASSGNMTLSGAVQPSTTIDYLNLNSFYDVKLWSWRELYQ